MDTALQNKASQVAEVAKKYAARFGEKGTSFYFGIDVNGELEAVKGLVGRGELAMAQKRVDDMSAKVYGNGPDTKQVNAAMEAFKSGKPPKDQLTNASTLTMLEFTLQVGAWYREQYDRTLQEQRALLAERDNLGAQLQLSTSEIYDLKLLKTELEVKLAEVQADLQQQLSLARETASQLAAKFEELRIQHANNRQEFEAGRRTHQMEVQKLSESHEEATLKVAEAKKAEAELDAALSGVKQSLEQMTTERAGLSAELQNTRRQLDEATGEAQLLARKMLAVDVRLQQGVASMTLNSNRSSTRRAQLVPRVSSSSSSKAGGAVEQLKSALESLRAPTLSQQLTKRIDGLADRMIGLKDAPDGTEMSKVQKETMLSLTRALWDLTEDIASTVRIYVRVKPPGAPAGSGQQQSTISTGATHLTLQCDLTGPKRYDGFFAVYDELKTTEQLYDSDAFVRLMTQVSTGYHVVMFGYGASGAGKTFTLLGDGAKNYGLLQLALTRIKDVKSAKLLHAFELYADEVVYTTNDRKAHGQVIWLTSRSSGTMTMASMLAKGNVTDESKQLQLGGDYTADPAGMASLNSDLKAIDDHRQGRQRTNQKTPNNTRSSRSHLFLTYEVKAGGTTGYLTVVDMAGREEPRWAVMPVRS
ncbi:hypothetical protein OEZ85_011004 [Tetradesmus obliquus]|uniref:Kinesin motor domain-containing protein n=1 Tax=Tetradesmus obliquus TaxID=3088 RepID=A0ABY8TR24_TETOB|nr:hypothetical protein OEZ85_011004 [Tetradesmus obliquus]